MSANFDLAKTVQIRRDELVSFAQQIVHGSASDVTIIGALVRVSTRNGRYRVGSLLAMAELPSNLKPEEVEEAIFLSVEFGDGKDTVQGRSVSNEYMHETEHVHFAGLAARHMLLPKSTIPGGSKLLLSTEELLQVRKRLGRSDAYFNRSSTTVVSGAAAGEQIDTDELVAQLVEDKAQLKAELARKDAEIRELQLGLHDVTQKAVANQQKIVKELQAKVETQANQMKEQRAEEEKAREAADKARDAIKKSSVLLQQFVDAARKRLKAPEGTPVKEVLRMLQEDS